MSIPAGWLSPSCPASNFRWAAMNGFAPSDIDELRDAIGEALAAEEPVELIAGGSKRGLGRPLQLPRNLDLSHLTGVRDYQPSELVLTAAAATPLEEIDAVLAGAGQMLAFEPPDWGQLLGLPEPVARRRTLGGVLSCNLSGPRRIKAGAARDHFLGFRGVSGRGEVFKAGGKVVKNVTGYDLCKLMAGSYGTLAALEEVTVKVLPRPETVSTLLLCPLDPAGAARCLKRALSSPHEVSGAAYLPASSTAILQPFSGASGVAAFRLEGPAPSVIFRREQLIKELAADRETAVLDDEASIAFWREVRDVLPLVDLPGRTVWRVSVAPSRGAELGEALADRLDARWYLDWGGGLVWAAVADADDGGAVAIRSAIRGVNGDGTGHATLIKGPPSLRQAVPVFESQPAELAALVARVKEGFDPRRILNPGRILEGQ
jgi:glycolate oxidase FAD binding subunit